MKAKVHKVELLIIDTESINDYEVKCMLSNVKYLYPEVLSMKTVEVDWHDDHPLNKHDTASQALKELFPGE